MIGIWIEDEFFLVEIEEKCGEDVGEGFVELVDVDALNNKEIVEAANDWMTTNNVPFKVLDVHRHDEGSDSETVFWLIDTPVEHRGFGV